MGTRSWNSRNVVMPPKPCRRPYAVSALVSRICRRSCSWAWTGVPQSVLKCRSDRGALTHSTSRPTRDIGRSFPCLGDLGLVDRVPLQGRLVDLDAEPGAWRAWGRAAAVAELDQRRHRVLAQQVPP